MRTLIIHCILFISVNEKNRLQINDNVPVLNSPVIFIKFLIFFGQVAGIFHNKINALPSASCLFCFLPAFVFLFAFVIIILRVLLCLILTLTLTTCILLR